MTPRFFQSIRKRFRKSVAQNKSNIPSSRFDTSDIVQEGCLQIWLDLERNGNGDDNKVLSAWLRKIAIGHVCKFYRLNMAAKRNMNRDQNLGEEVCVADGDLNPQSAAETRELAARLLESLEDLADEERYVVVRHFFDEQSFDSIASEMKLSRYRVTEICKRAMQVLEVKLST